jgi:multidrug efflux pump subunit AcrA (membrane-fusion protein)
MPSAPAPESKDPAPAASPAPEPPPDPKGVAPAPAAESAPPPVPDVTPAAPDAPAGVPAPAPALDGAELGSRKETLKTLAIMLIAVAILGVVFAVSLGWEIPGLAGEKAHADKNQEPAPLKVDLVKDEKDPKKFVPHTLSVPEEVRVSLGIRKNKEDVVALAGPPTSNQTLEFPGSTAFNPARIARIRVRFPTNGSEVVSIGKTVGTVSPTVFRELRPGDEVKAGQELVTFYSVDVGSKKNDLIDAICQFKLDQEIYDRAVEARGAVSDVFVLNALRNVAGDINTINRAVKTLETWNVPREDIEAVKKEAEEISKRLIEKRGLRPEVDPEKERQWGKVVLKAPIRGVIVERNITANEIVVDNTVNVFQIANVDELLVVVNVPEDLLPRLREIRDKEGLTWTIQTAGAPVKFRIAQKVLDTLRTAGAPAGVLDRVAALRDREFGTRTALEDELARVLTREQREGWQKNVTDAAKVGLVGPVDEIGYLIDPNTHTAVLKGFIKNESGALRAGQYVNAIIDLPREPNVVEIPMAALADDGRQTVVFVQPDPAKPHYTLRRVKVTHRFDRVAYVSSVLTDADIALGNAQAKDGLLPFSPLKEGDRVLTSGILELKKELEDRESALATAKKP